MTKLPGPGDYQTGFQFRNPHRMFINTAGILISDSKFLLNSAFKITHVSKLIHSTILEKELIDLITVSKKKNRCLQICLIPCFIFFDNGVLFLLLLIDRLGAEAESIQNHLY